MFTSAEKKGGRRRLNRRFGLRGMIRAARHRVKEGQRTDPLLSRQAIGLLAELHESARSIAGHSFHEHQVEGGGRTSIKLVSDRKLHFELLWSLAGDVRFQDVVARTLLAFHSRLNTLGFPDGRNKGQASKKRNKGQADREPQEDKFDTTLGHWDGLVPARVNGTPLIVKLQEVAASQKATAEDGQPALAHIHLLRDET